MRKRVILRFVVWAAVIFSAVVLTGCGGGSREGGNDFTFEVSDIAFDMVFIKGGMFTMGCTSEQGNECNNDENPAQKVKLSSFFIGKHEVTQAQWMAVMGTDPSRFKGGNLPVENVSWNEVQTFIVMLNTKTGKQYRLPTEAEWEYAARGGSESKNFKYAGSNNIDEVAWYADNSSGQTRPVATKLPNELGIHDMSGNVWEWVSDWYGSYTADVKINPAGPAWGYSHVDRGGSWGHDAQNCRVSIRLSGNSESRFDLLGFRLALPFQ